MEKNEVFKWFQCIFGRTFLFVLIFAGCSSRPCREPRAPELDRTKAAAVAASAAAGSLNVESAGAPKKPTTGADPRDRDAGPELARVYKPDGSRQCEKKQGVPLDVMERELAGIAVVGRDKRKDGLMHVQVCGSPSGMINVFEIGAAFLKQAEQRGFKRLED